MFCPWSEIDTDCCQHIRNDGDVYEMIQCVWLDTTDDDREEGLHEYCVVRMDINLNDYTNEEKEMFLSSYGYTLDSVVTEYGDVADSIIAECILESEILRDSCVIADADSFEEAQNIVLKYMME